MDPLNITVDSLETIPEAFRPLYSEVDDGKFKLTGVAGMKTEDDINRLQTALTHEKTKRSEATGKLQPILDALGDRSFDDVLAELDRIPELEARAGEDNAEAIEAAKRSAVAPLQRELEKISKRAETAENQVSELKKTIFESKLSDELRKVAQEAKMTPTAIEDWILLGKTMFEEGPDGQGFIARESGLTPDLVLSDLKEKRPHWWPVSKGGGATGGGTNTLPGGGANPWSAAGYNKTEQAAYVREHGIEKAKQMAALAGNTLHGPKPAENK